MSKGPLGEISAAQLFLKPSMSFSPALRCFLVGFSRTGRNASRRSSKNSRVSSPRFRGSRPDSGGSPRALQGFDTPSGNFPVDSLMRVHFGSPQDLFKLFVGEWKCSHKVFALGVFKLLFTRS